MTIYPIIFIFFIGLLIGSFLNVVLFRTERNEGFVRGRSRCMACNTTLRWFDNIPLLSFLVLGGKCRYCSVSLSWQYPLVELSTGLLFVISLLLSQNLFISLAEQVLFVTWLCSTLCVALLILVYDIRYLAIPVVFLWSLCILLLSYVVLYTLLFSAFHPVFPSISSFLWGGFVAGSFFFLLVFVSKETWMGWGDVWIGAWAGALVGIELVQIYITLSFSFGALVGVTLLYTREKSFKSEVPFAPYLLVAALVIMGVKIYNPSILEFLSPWFLATI